MSSVLEPATARPPATTAAEPAAEPEVKWDGLFPASLRAVMLYCCDAALLLLGFQFYTTVPGLLEPAWADAVAWLKGHWPEAASLPLYKNTFAATNAAPTLYYALIVYLVALPLYYATFPDTYRVKSRLFWEAVLSLWRRRPTPKEAVAIRAVAVKAFFMPLMLVWLVPAVIALVKVLDDQPDLARYAAEKGWFVGFYYPVALLIIIVDLSCFTVAYGVEHPRLGNEIKSVEPTFLGWAVALMCYPPFALISAWALGWYERDDPLPAAPVLTGCLMLLLMGTYAAASVALGLRGGNLVHRGVVDRWPYSVIRHPAYLCKNLFWCTGAVPALIHVWGQPYPMVCVVLSSAAWFGVYTLRALTEERHLMRDPAYQEYCRRVKYRYIPGVW